MTDAIRFEMKGDVAELCLCAPERRNAIGSREISLVKTAIDSIPDTCRLFVIRIRGPRFLWRVRTLRKSPTAPWTGDGFSVYD